MPPGRNSFKTIIGSISWGNECRQGGTISKQLAKHFFVARPAWQPNLEVNAGRLLEEINILRKHTATVATNYMCPPFFESSRFFVKRRSPKLCQRPASPAGSPTALPLTISSAALSRALPAIWKVQPAAVIRNFSVQENSDAWRCLRLAENNHWARSPSTFY